MMSRGTTPPFSETVAAPATGLYGGCMKSNTLLPLALALAISLLATACKRDADFTPPAEPAAATEPVVETAAAPDEQGPPPSPPMPAPAPAARAMDSGMTFAAMDKNGDGGITRDELADT